MLSLLWLPVPFTYGYWAVTSFLRSIDPHMANPDLFYKDCVSDYPHWHAEIIGEGVHTAVSISQQGTSGGHLPPTSQSEADCKSQTSLVKEQVGNYPYNMIGAGAYSMIVPIVIPLLFIWALGYGCHWIRQGFVKR